MKKTIFIILTLFASSRVFSQTNPATPAPVNPIQLTTNTFYFEPASKRHFVWNGLTYLWWQPTDSIQVARMIINATAGSGTVTSITPGLGFVSHTPITTAGTLVIDTMLIRNGLAARGYVDNKLAGKANLSGGNTFTDDQTINNGSVQIYNSSNATAFLANNGTNYFEASPQSVAISAGSTGTRLQSDYLQFHGSGGQTFLKANLTGSSNNNIFLPDASGTIALVGRSDSLFKSKLDTAKYTTAILPGYMSNAFPYNSQAHIQDNVVNYKTNQYIAFVSDSLKAMIAKRSYPSGDWHTYNLNTISGNPFGNQGADGHNTYAIGFDSLGYIHVAGNMHNDPMRYVRSVSPQNIDSWTAPGVVGMNEDSVSYPIFFNTPDGSLFLFHRNGFGSGNANTYVDRYDVATTTWKRVAFLTDGKTYNNSFYENHIVVDTTGRIHISGTWRTSPDPTTNQKMCYFYSDDKGLTWKQGNGTAYTLPITLATSAPVYDFPPNSGVINQTGMGVDKSGRVFIVTTEYDGSNNTQLARIYMDVSKVWHHDFITNWTSGKWLIGTTVSDNAISRPSVITTKNNETFMTFSQTFDRKTSRDALMCADITPGNTVKFFPLINGKPGIFEVTFDTKGLLGNRLRMLLSAGQNYPGYVDKQKGMVYDFDLKYIDSLRDGKLFAPNLSYLQNTYGTTGEIITQFSAQTFNQAVPAIASTREYLYRGRVNDDPTSEVFIGNGTTTNSSFVTRFGGYNVGVSDIGAATYTGSILNTNDVVNFNTPIVNFQAFKTTASPDPNNGAISQLFNRPLFGFLNNNIYVAKVYASGAWIWQNGGTYPTTDPGAGRYGFLGMVYPMDNNARTLGQPTLRWSTSYQVNSSISGNAILSGVAAGTPGLDSILVKSGTTNIVRRISATYYSPTASPAFTGTPTTPTPAFSTTALNIINQAYLPSAAPVVLATVTGINAKSTGTTALYTVPASKTAVITGYVVTVSAATSITTGPAADIGDSITGAASIVSNQAMNALTGLTNDFVFNITGMSHTVAATGVVNFNINSGSTGTSQTITVSLIGFLK